MFILRCAQLITLRSWAEMQSRSVAGGLTLFLKDVVMMMLLHKNWQETCVKVMGVDTQTKVC